MHAVFRKGGIDSHAEEKKKKKLLHSFAKHVPSTVRRQVCFSLTDIWTEGQELHVTTTGSAVTKVQAAGPGDTRMAADCGDQGS